MSKVAELNKINKKIIHFNSKEGLVWREETAEDRLLNMLNKETKNYANRRSMGKNKNRKTN